jgi:replicative DNA helicase
VNLSNLRRYSLEEDEQLRVKGACKRMKNTLYFEDVPSLTVNQLRAKARNMVMKHDLKLLGLDYLQLVRGSGKKDSRVNEIAEISGACKEIAREFDIPVLVLSQLSRSVEHREDKKPRLADLRDGGSIEQDADLCLLLYREDYYKGLKALNRDQIEVDIAKHRNGPTGVVNLSFDKRFGTFGDLAQVPALGGNATGRVENVQKEEKVNYQGYTYQSRDLSF